MIYPLTKPSRDAVADYDLASARRRGATVRRHLLLARDSVLAAYDAYDKNAGIPSKISPVRLTADQAVALRKNYPLTYEGAGLSSIRSEAMAATFRGLCPMCGRGEVAELDHYLPRETYPEFSLLSLNLIPTCKACNHNKSKLVGSPAGARFLHSYYDQFPGPEPILTARLVVSDGVVAEFAISRRLPDELRRNASYHFEKLRLSRAYASASAVELLERLDSFSAEHEYFGSAGLMRMAEKTAKSLRARFGPHYWKAALYDSIAASRVFCDGGYRLLFPV